MTPRCGFVSSLEQIVISFSSIKASHTPGIIAYYCFCSLYLPCVRACGYVDLCQWENPRETLRILCLQSLFRSGTVIVVLIAY